MIVHSKMSSPQVRHVKHSSSDNSFGYYEKSLGIVTMDGKPLIISKLRWTKSDTTVRTNKL